MHIVQIEPMIWKTNANYKNKVVLKVLFINCCQKFMHTLIVKQRVEVSMLFVEVYAYVLLTSNGAIDY
jgi:hypothetical protein